MTRRQLPSERRSENVARKIRGEFMRKFHNRGTTFYEHGQWWIENQITGAQYSVVDTLRGFDFEQITHGDNE